MKLAVLCCTFHRPHLLGQLVDSFLRQDYPRHLRELVILDDAGQYDNQAGPEPGPATERSQGDDLRPVRHRLAVLALQETPRTHVRGSPWGVGDRTGAPFIQDGITGVCVDRLPPGAKCVKDDADSSALDAYRNSVHRVTEMDRRSVRLAAAVEFDTERIVDRVIAEVEGLRVVCSPWSGDN